MTDQPKRKQHRILTTNDGKNDECLDCGATRQWSLASKWPANYWRRPTPWMLDGKRQPYCSKWQAKR